jgi:ketosteroid isomerase-like protein
MDGNRHFESLLISYMHSLKTVFVVGILFMGGCTQNNYSSEEEKAALISEIKQLLDEYPEAVKRKDLDWFSSFWSNEKDFVFAFDGHVHTDYDKWFSDYYREGLSNLKVLTHFEWSNPSVAVLDKNLVSYTTNFNWRMVTVSGDTVKSNGSALYIFKKSDGRWSVVNSAGTHIYY